MIANSYIYGSPFDQSTADPMWKEDSSSMIKVVWRLTSRPDPNQPNWAVTYGYSCRANRRGKLSFESGPSSRTERYIKSHSFTLEEAEKVAKKVMKQAVAAMARRHPEYFADTK